MKEYKVKAYADGKECWYLNGKLHREDAPAIVYADGSKCYAMNGVYHRTDGPAREYVSGKHHYYLEGKQYNLASWLIEVERRALVKQYPRCEGKVVIVDGVEYELRVRTPV